MERRYGHQQQTEEFRMKFRTKVWGSGESFTHLAEDLEVLVRRVYRKANGDMLTILLHDQFVDAISHPQIRICVQEAHPKNLEEALARDLEMESFLRMKREQPTGNFGSPRQMEEAVDARVACRAGEERREVAGVPNGDNDAKQKPTRDEKPQSRGAGQVRGSLTHQQP
ncbi:hypothetical protein O3P69_012283 [Scylla paramamosain]|uniref:Uncharacterized protein n=1 Tax=Scylla paramamosain TaxID=85552 RepID=A0AAW0TCE7_SCYPA